MYTEIFFKTGLENMHTFLEISSKFPSNMILFWLILYIFLFKKTISQNGKLVPPKSAKYSSKFQNFFGMRLPLWSSQNWAMWSKTLAFVAYFFCVFICQNAYLKILVYSFRLNDPKELVAFQTEEWDPMLNWMNERYITEITSTMSIVAPPIPESTYENLRNHLNTRSDWALVGEYRKGRIWVTTAMHYYPIELNESTIEVCCFMLESSQGILCGNGWILIIDSICCKNQFMWILFYFRKSSDNDLCLSAVRTCFKNGHRTSNPLISNSFRIANSLPCYIKHVTQ